MTLVGLTGYSGAGKDTVALLLAERFPIARIAFADRLKQELSRAWGVDMRLFYDRGLKEVRLHQLALAKCTEKAFVDAHEHLLPLDALKPRTLMQTWGDWRRKTDSQYFVRALAETLELLVDSGTEHVIVTDCRYVNEIVWLRSRRGLLWRVDRPEQKAPPSGHSSEKEWRDAVVDAVIVNDGSTEQLAKVATDLFIDAVGAARIAASERAEKEQPRGPMPGHFLQPTGTSG